MWGAIRFLISLILAVWLAVWLAENPGWMQFEWLGYRVEMPFALMLVLVFLLGAVMAVLYRSWVGLRHVPSLLNRQRRERRMHRGYEALNQCMVALAAGDGGRAANMARRADELLDEAPVTLLLAAQAAQLRGDKESAGRYYQRMAEIPELEFLGLRGLFERAMEAGQRDRALSLAERARRLRPRAEWVLKGLFDLQVAAGQWERAQATVSEMAQAGLIGRDEAQHRKAVLLTQAASGTEESTAAPTALKTVSEAADMDANLVPAAIGKARLLIESGKGRKAVGVIERAWAHTPNPMLAELYLTARSPSNPLARFKALQGLAKRNPEHIESRVAVARAALDAKLWGEVRRYLDPLTKTGEVPPGRVCRLLAELEEQENGDADKARHWLSVAAISDPDPAWVCGKCGHLRGEWAATCDSCGSFDSLTWAVPGHAAGGQTPPAAAGSA